MTEQETKIIPWYRMMWFVQSQDPNVKVDLMCEDTWLIARYLSQFGEDAWGSIHDGIVTVEEERLKYEYDSSLTEWRQLLRFSLSSADFTFSQLLESMNNFQLNKLRKN